MTKKVKVFLIICIIVLVCSLFLIFTIKKDTNQNSNIDNKLVGIWNLDDNTKYEFKSDGSGHFTIPTGKYLFKYSVENNIISFDYEDENSVDSKYEYKVIDKTLELVKVGENTSKFVLKKQ